MKFAQFRRLPALLRDLSLKSRLTGMSVGLVVIVIWALAFLSTHVLRGQLERLLSEQQFAATRLLAADLDEKLRQRVEGLSRAATELSPEMPPDQLQAALAQRPLMHVVFNGGIALLGPDGRIVADYPAVPGRRGADFGHRPYFKRVVESGRPYIDKPYFGSIVKRPLLMIGVPVFDGAGKVGGVLVGITDLNAPSFLGFVTDRGVSGAAEYFVISLRDSVIVAATDAKRAMTAAPARGLAPFYDKVVDGYDGSGIAISSEGISKLYSSKRVPSADWIVLAALPTAIAFEPVRTLLAYMYAIAGVLTLLAILFVRRMVHQMLTPLDEASAAMRRMTGGQAPLQTLPIARGDEVGALLGSFNMLVQDRRRYETEVAASEARFRSLFGHMLEGFAYCRMIFEGEVAADFVYVEVNPAFERLTGLANVVGKRISEVIPGVREANPELLEIYGRVARGAPPERFETYLPALDHWFSISVYCPEPEYFVAVFDVITGRKRAEQAQQRLNRSLRLLTDCNTALVHARREQELLDQVCRLMVERGGYRMAWVGYAEEGGDRMVRPVAASGVGTAYLEKTNIAWSDTEAGRGPTGSAIRLAQTQVNHDFSGNPATSPWRQSAEEYGFHSSIALPLLGEQRAFGALTVYAGEADAFTEEEVALLEELAGDLAYGIETLRGRSQRELAEERLAFLAHHDALTGLPNRLLLRDRFEHAAVQAQRMQQRVAMLFLDLDNFKQVNDSLGHDLGDRLLVDLVDRLQGCIRDSDTMSRQGGDEFIVLLGDIEDTAVIARVAQQLLDAVAEPFVIEGQALTTSFSIGISIYPDDGEDFDTLLKHADTALYHAKDSGRDAYRFYAAAMNVDALARMQLQNRLRGALKNGEFLLHYQAQVDIASGNVVGVEALLRWQPTAGELVAPGNFIPVAEQSGLIIPIGEWVLGEACRQARRWRDAGLPALTMAVNISALQFRRGNILDTVARALAESQLPAGSLELELTESVLLNDTEGAIKTLGALKDLGVKLSIDDFGTGYSSLSYLKRLAVDRLKIDQSFVRDIATDPDDAAIVHAIIQLGRTLQLTVIAEGVETARQLAFLRGYGCDQAQGYLFSRPVPAADAEAVLRQGMS